MSQQRARVRKIIYVAIIAGLLIPLYIMSNPRTSKTSGGVLARMRHDNGLSESNLGKIDPASGAAKLVTFGMRGVATALLWQKAQEYQEKKLWTELKATSEQIMVLEPHFVSVWENQTWNLAYNVSAEFDDYQQRYQWVIKGVNFGADGCDYNEHSARLPFYVGWVISQKIGRADEKEQFRRMFREDDEFHEDPRHLTESRADRDNWLVGMEWYDRAEKLYDEGATIGKKSELHFKSRKPMCRMNYAEAIQEEGVFGEKSIREWELANSDWVNYGNAPVTSTFDDENGEKIVITLNEMDTIESKITELNEQLLELAPGLRDQLLLEKWDSLTSKEQASLLKPLSATDIPDKNLNDLRDLLDERSPDWRDALTEAERSILTAEQWEAIDTPERLQTPAQQALAAEGNSALGEIRRRCYENLALTADALAERVEGDAETVSKALNIAQAIADNQRRMRIVENYRNQVEYAYWLNHSAVEQKQLIVDARQLRYEAREAYYAGELQEANEMYLAAMDKLRQAIDLKNIDREADSEQYDFLTKNQRTRNELIEMIDKYKVLLDRLDEIYPEDFPLQEFLHESIADSPQIESAAKADAKAKAALAAGDLDEALRASNAGIAEWNDLMMASPYLQMWADPIVGQQMLDSCAIHSDVLEARGAVLTDQFPLREVLQNLVKHDKNRQAASRARIIGADRLKEAKLDEAEEELNKAVNAWAALLERFPLLYQGLDPSVDQAVNETVRDYLQVLEARGKELPADMPLLKFQAILKQRVES